MYLLVTYGLVGAHADYFTLRRFLRARSYDLEKATAMWLNHLAFKNEWKVDSILQDFYFVSMLLLLLVFWMLRLVPLAAASV
jgi:hypothetical protein